MWLVLCNPEDAAAIWAFHGLKKRGLEPIMLVTADMLAYSTTCEYHLSTVDSAISFHLNNGLSLESRAIKGVLNRLQYVPTDHFQTANPQDREYAVQEFQAFFVSWVYSLPEPVINRATVQGMSGQWRSRSEWIQLAFRAGLPAAAYTQSSRDLRADETDRHAQAGSQTVIVLDGEVVSADLPASLGAACRRFAALAETRLLGIEFSQTSLPSWQCVGATPFPDLRFGGPALLDRLAAILRNEGG